MPLPVLEVCGSGDTQSHYVTRLPWRVQLQDQDVCSAGLQLWDKTKAWECVTRLEIMVWRIQIQHKIAGERVALERDTSPSKFATGL